MRSRLPLVNPHGPPSLSRQADKPFSQCTGAAGSGPESARVLPFIPLDLARKTAHDSVPAGGGTVLSGRRFHKPTDLVHGRLPTGLKGGLPPIPLPGTQTSPRTSTEQPLVPVRVQSLTTVNEHPVLKRFDVATERQEGELKQKHHTEREQFAGEFMSPFNDDTLDGEHHERAFEQKLKVGIRLITKHKIERDVFQEDRAIARRGLERWVIAGAVSGADTGSSGTPVTIAEPEEAPLAELDRAQPEPEAPLLGDIMGTVLTSEALAPGPEAVLEPTPEADRAAEPAPLDDSIGPASIPDAAAEPQAEVIEEPETKQTAEPDHAVEPEPEPEPEAEQVTESEPEPVVEPEVEQVTEPDRAPETESEPASVAIGDLIGSMLRTGEVPEPEVLADREAEQTAEPDRAAEPEPEQEAAPQGAVIGATYTQAPEAENVVEPEVEQRAASDRAAESEPAPLGDILRAALLGPEPVADPVTEPVAEPDRAGDAEPQPAVGSLGDVIAETLTGEAIEPVGGDAPAPATPPSSPAPSVIDLTPKRGKRIRKKYKPGDVCEVSIQTDRCLEDEDPGDLWLECETAEEWPVDEPSPEKATPERPIDRLARGLAGPDGEDASEASPGERSPGETEALENSGPLHDRSHSTSQTDPVSGLPDLEEVLSSQNQKRSLIDDGNAPV